MAKRITITIHDDISDETAIRLVKRVISAGKLSRGAKGQYYCWATICQNAPEGDIVVYTSPRSLPTNASFQIMKV